LSIQPDLSIIVPLYNEEDSVAPLYAAIVNAVAAFGVTFEIVLVDDGSKDSTVKRAVELAQADSHVRIVKFRRNYGQTAAMAAGIAAWLSFPPNPPPIRRHCTMT